MGCDALKQIRVVHHNTVFVYGKLRPEAAAIEILEEIELVGQPRIGLRLRMNRQARGEDPCRSEIPPLTDSHRLAANREAVGKRSWPDIHVHATVEIIDGSAIPVSPVTLPVRSQTERSGGSLCRHGEFGIAEPPRCVPVEAIGESERTTLLVERDTTLSATPCAKSKCSSPTASRSLLQMEVQQIVRYQAFAIAAAFVLLPNSVLDKVCLITVPCWIAKPSSITWIFCNYFSSLSLKFQPTSECPLSARQQEMIERCPLDQMLVVTANHVVARLSCSRHRQKTRWPVHHHRSPLSNYAILRECVVTNSIPGRSP